MLLGQQNSPLNKKHYSSVWCSWKPGSNTSRTRIGRNNTKSHPTPTNDIFLEAKLHRRKPNCYTCSGGTRYCTKLNIISLHPQETLSGGFPSQVPLTPGKAKLTWILSTPTFTELINPCCRLPVPSRASPALWSWQVQMRSSSVRISSESPWTSFCPILATWTQGCQASIASASLEGHIPEVRASLLIPCHARAFDVTQPGWSSSSCSVITCVGPREANSALAFQTVLTARHVAQADPGVRARQVTRLIPAIITSWAFIRGYTPSTATAWQIQGA